jgi:serine/threonine-protein kinase
MVDDGKILVSDASSPNGTFVNGQKVSELELHPGDILRVGNSHLRLEPDDLADTVDDVAEVVDDQVEVVEEEVSPMDQLLQLVGHRLAHFELESILGKGIHGVVFRAVDVDHRNEVAIKVLSPVFPANSSELQQFAKALKSVYSLRHANLVTWLSAGKSGPYCWIAEELVEGESLAQLTARHDSTGRAAVQNGIKLMHDLVAALNYLHGKNLAHGNITPANILIQLVDRRAKLNDLCLKGALLNSDLQVATLEDKILVDLPYTAPERLETGAFVDPFVADMYSLGAVVYLRITGRPPFEGNTPADTIEQIFSGEIVKPKKLVPGVSENLQAVLLRMLSRNQEDRYQTPRELIQDLERLQIR